MSIREQIIVEIATVEVNDEYRVELTQVLDRVDYSPEQARDLASELINAADEAERMIAEHVAEVGERITNAELRHVDGRVVL